MYVHIAILAGWHSADDSTNVYIDRNGTHIYILSAKLKKN